MFTNKNNHKLIDEKIFREIFNENIQEELKIQIKFIKFTKF